MRQVESVQAVFPRNNYREAIRILLVLYAARPFSLTKEEVVRKITERFWKDYTEAPLSERFDEAFIVLEVKHMVVSIQAGEQTKYVIADPGAKLASQIEGNARRHPEQWGFLVEPSKSPNAKQIPAIPN